MSVNKYNAITGELELLAGGSTASSSIFVGTAVEWTAETDKTDFNAALITDVGTVNAVDDTTGDTEVVANKNVVFKGTMTEWEALTIAEKKTYDQALITNDTDTGEVVNAVTNGDMRAVTSNAVYDAMNTVTTGTVNDTNVNGDTTINWIKNGRIIIYNIDVSNIQTGSQLVWSVTLPQNIRPSYAMQGMKSVLLWDVTVMGEAYIYDGGTSIRIGTTGDSARCSGQIIAFV